MSLPRLIEFFSTYALLPVEIDDVRDQILSYNVQDEIIFRPVDLDPNILRGLYYQFKRLRGAYTNEYCSLILYSSNLSIEWQRVVCCKEMIHALDAKGLKTSTEPKVIALAKRIMNSGDVAKFVSTFKMSVPPKLEEIEAYKDFIAFFQALAVLFPSEYREAILPAYKDNKISLETISRQAQLPEELVEFIMLDGWEELQPALATF